MICFIHKNNAEMGLVRFERTIDGSLRSFSTPTDHQYRPRLASSVDPSFIKYRWSPSPFLTRPQPPRQSLYIFYLALFYFFFCYILNQIYIAVYYYYLTIMIHNLLTIVQSFCIFSNLKLSSPVLMQTFSTLFHPSLFIPF